MIDKLRPTREGTRFAHTTDGVKRLFWSTISPDSNIQHSSVLISILKL